MLTARAHTCLAVWTCSHIIVTDPLAWKLRTSSTPSTTCSASVVNLSQRVAVSCASRLWTRDPCNSPNASHRRQLRSLKLLTLIVSLRSINTCSTTSQSWAWQRAFSIRTSRLLRPTILCTTREVKSIVTQKSCKFLEERVGLILICSFFILV